MKFALLVALVACRATTADDYPVMGGGFGGGGGGGSGSGATDAGVDATPDPPRGVALTGRVCLLANLRNLTVCSPTGAKGLIVSLGSRSTTTTTDDGSFAFTAQLGDGFAWRVKGDKLDRIMPSIMPFGADNTIPVIGVATYQEVQGSNSVTPSDQQGAVVVRVVQGTAPVANAIVAAPAALPPILYDAPDLQTWGQSRTGALGVAWLPLVPLAVTPPTSVAISITPAGATAVTASALVENGAITFITKDIH